VENKNYGDAAKYTSGGTLSGDFSPKTAFFGEKHTETPPELVFCILCKLIQ